MAGGRIAGITVVLDGDATKLNAALKSVDSQVKQTQSQLKDINKLLKLDPGNTELLTQKQKYLGEALTETKTRLAALKEVELNNIGELDNVQLDALRREIAETEQQLRSLERQGATTNKSLQALNTLGDKWQAAGQKIEGVGRSIMPVSMAATALGAAGIKAAMDWETAFTGVKKTVDATDEEYAQLAKGIQQMATETASSMEEIAGVAEVAGQLGIAKESLLDFTRVMVELGDTTNLSAEEAATALARFMNITGESSGSIENLGSSIVALGNNFATSEAEIVDMATNLAAAGTLVGLSSTDILALSTAMSSVGIEAAAGGSAMSQTLNELETAVASFSAGSTDSLEKIADVAGMSAQDFANAWNTHPIEAIQAFITGLGKLDEKGESATLVLDELGMSGLRQENMLKSLGLASEELAGAIETASKAYQDNTALSDEAALRYETTAAKMNQFKEAAKQAGIALGDTLLPMLTELMEKLKGVFEWFSNLPDGVQNFIGKIVMLTAVLGPLLIAIGKLSTGIGALLKLPGQISTFASSIGEIAAKITGVSSAASDAASAAGTVATALEGAGTAAAGAATSAGTAATGVTTLGAALGTAASVAGVFGGAVAILGYSINDYITDTKSFNEAMSIQYQTVAEAEAAIAALREEYETNHIALEDKLNSDRAYVDEMKREEELLQLIENAQAQLTELTANQDSTTASLTETLDENTTSLEENATALDEATDSIEQTTTDGKETATEALTEVSEKTSETCTSITESFSSLNETLPPIFEQLKTLIVQTWTEITQSIMGTEGEMSLADKFTEMGVALTTALQGWSTTVVPALEVIRVAFETFFLTITTNTLLYLTQIQTTVTTTLTLLQETILLFWTTETELLTTTMTSVITLVTENLLVIQTTVQTTCDTIYTLVLTMFTNILAAVTENMGLIVNTVITNFNTMVAYIQSLVAQSYGWGADFVANFEAGIMSRMSSLLARVQSMAAQIRSYLHFSEPDKGPLADFHTWMPDFMEGLAHDIDKSSYLVEDAVSRVAANMQINPTVGAMAGAYSGSTGRVNHTGVIRVEGVNDRSQLASVVDIVIDELRREVRM